MNKTFSIILIVLLSILTIFVCAVFIYLMSGNSFNWNFNFDSYSENLIDSKEVLSVEEIKVDSKNTKISIEQSVDSKIIVEMYSDNKVDHSIKFENNVLDIHFYDNEIMRLFKKQNRVIIKLPKDYENKVNINSTTGDIKFASFEKLSPNVVLGTGDIHADRLNELNAVVTTGDIKINELNKISCKLTTGDVKLEKVNDAIIHSTTGNIKIQELNNLADITLTTGDVKITKATINEDSNISLTTGDVKISSYSGAYVETSNNVGDVKVNNNDRSAAKTLKISVRVGDIRVN